MKGQYPTGEMQYLPKGFELKTSHELTVPFVEGERHLLEIGRVAPSQEDNYET